MSQWGYSDDAIEAAMDKIGDEIARVVRAHGVEHVGGTPVLIGVDNILAAILPILRLDDVRIATPSQTFTTGVSA